MSDKFKVGDRIEMTEDTLRCNPNTKSTRGEVVAVDSPYIGTIRVKRDGLKTIDWWSEEAWQHETTHPV